jgi:hypothetical protein
MATVVHRAQPDTWSTKKAFWVGDAQQLRHIANGSLPLAKALSRDHLFSFLRTFAQWCNWNILIHCSSQHCQAVMSLVEMVAKGWIIPPSYDGEQKKTNGLAFHWCTKDQCTGAPMCGRPVIVCSRKKKQIRFFMQLEMIWIRSAHLACKILMFLIFLCGTLRLAVTITWSKTDPLFVNKSYEIQFDPIFEFQK